jgi:hypothetical protein
MESNPMKAGFGKDTFELFSSLTETLQACMKSNKIEQATKVAQERHNVLVSLLENAALMGLERSEYASQAMECVREERGLASYSSSQSRSDFVSRKTAFKAYGMRTA